MSSEVIKRPRLKKSAAALLLAIFGVLAFVVILWRAYAQPSSAYRLRPGLRLSYDLDFSSLSDFDFRILFNEDGASSAHDTRTDSNITLASRIILRAELTLSMIERKAGLYHVEYRFNDPRLSVEVNGKEEQAQMPLIEKTLSMATYAHMGPRGRIVALSTPPGANDVGRGLIHSALAMTQFVFSGGIKPQSERWEVEEDEPNGLYIARYTPTPVPPTSPKTRDQSIVMEFQKIKLRYLPETRKPAGSQLKPQSSTIPEGALEAVFDLQQGLLKSLKGSELIRSFIADKEVGRSARQIALNFVQKIRLPQSEISSMKEAYRIRTAEKAPVPLSAEKSDKDNEDSIQRNALGEETVDTLLDALEREEAAGEKRDTSLYLKFKALVYLNPQVSDVLAQVLVSSKPAGLTRSIISEALGTVGNEEAQTALAGALTLSQSDRDLQLKIIQQLSMLKNPIPLVEERFRILSSACQDERICTAAIIGLGNAARNLAGDDSKRSDRIVKWIADQIRPSLAEANIRILLMALGNSASRRAYSALSKYTKNESVLLRATAVAGLRWVDVKKVNKILAQALARDPDSSVRLSAAFALSFRTPVDLTLKAQEAALVEDQTPLVRLSVLRNLWEARNKVDDFAELLKKVMEKDPTDEVRNAAVELYAQWSSQDKVAGESLKR